MNPLSPLVKLILIVMIIAIFGNGADSQEQADNYAARRKAMVEKQIVNRGIKEEQVINSMLTVKRHLFVPTKYREEAYSDHPLPIGEGQTISQPYIVAFMTEVLAPDSNARILEIGTGSGYQAAVLAEICDSVFTVEIEETLGIKAKNLLRDLGYENIEVKIGDGYLGWKEKSPFDMIIVTCAPENIPTPLKEQLKDGGKMIIPVGPSYNQELRLLIKRDEKFITSDILPVRFVPMVDQKGNSY